MDKKTLGHMLENLIINADRSQCMEHSFKNYHAKGMSYLNLFRSDRLTIKVYFLDVNKLELVNNQRWLVNPHNHRYNFSTTVLWGAVEHLLFEENGRGGHYAHRFDYLADNPVNERFQPAGEKLLKITPESRIYQAGESYYCDIHDIHTLKVSDVNTGLLLFQYNDIETDGTVCYMPTNEAPTLSPDMYQKFTEKEIQVLLQRLWTNTRGLIG